MGITDKVSQIAGQVQDGVKNTSVSFVSLFLKLITAFFIALTLSLIAREMMGSGTFTFIFTMVLVVALVLKMIAKWSVGAVLLFDLFCVLVALLLRFYIQVAP
ncbi:MAG: hypothetical protein ACAH59_14425 [Pseudobdellovibrionaceae bacterium]